MKVLGLDICADTIVGDEMRRGISGSQKRRLTTGNTHSYQIPWIFKDAIFSIPTILFIKHIEHDNLKLLRKNSERIEL
ncbi:pleiotropic drug resistance protein 3-like isoform X2 [Pistacia vera]|uniref:pleiotropic drug resistance protein 3-like isoform X2 n=1 Tax=Pistacia vera TaxID=55513 RepID=UPI001263B334|nr:pleiotropic drug resistance protein 3-like isoform X2 [Pistacia vera]